MDKLEEKLGYKFKNRTLLRTALTHSSYANENGQASNERLEFLGDSILGMLAAEHIFLSKPNMPEGQMTQLRADLVCEESLASVAGELGLGEYLLLGKGEKSGGGKNRPSITADAVEAVIAALYLDGGAAPARAMVERYLTARASERILRDYKTALQELIQRSSGNTLRYETVSESGPDHMKTFMVRAILDDRIVGEGSGGTKKQAEQNAAKAAMEILG